MNRKLLAILLVVAMLATMLPMQAFAAEAVVLTSGSVTLATAKDGETYTYEWTATSNGTVIISMDAANPGWSYLISANGESLTWLKSGKTAKSEEYTVSAGDLVSIEFGSHDAAGWTQGNGTISYTVSFLASEDSSDVEVEKEVYAISKTALQMGDNTLTLDTGAVTTIYAFTPTEMGVYTFTANDAAALVGDWGPGSYLISDKTAEKTNTLEWTCTAVGQSIMIGVSGVEGTTLTIEKTADYVVVETKWTVVKNTEFANWKDYVIDSTTFEAIDVTDNVADVIVKGDDGLYHYGSVDGRVVVANMNANPWLNFGSAIASGASFRVASEDENGNYPTGVDMTDAIKEYSDKGRCPLTDELIYMFRFLGESKGWYNINTTDGFYLFGTKTVDPETAYLAFCGTVCEHSWVDADCENAKTCSACGKTDGESLGHTWTDADCENAKTCSVCGATDGDALGHSYGADGVCTACGDTLTFTVTYAGHGTDLVQDVTVAANTVITLPCRWSDLFSDTDRVFMGFNTEADGSGETYMDCTEYTVTGDVTLYAQWADIAVGDTFLNNGEYVDNNGNVTTTQPEGGYAHFENGTLTLNNFTYTGEGYLFYHYFYYNSTATSAVYYGMGDLNVVLEGENVLVNTTENGSSLRAVQNLTISGSGSLTAEANTVIFSEMAITVDSGILNLTAGHNGISASSSLTVNNGEITIVSDWYGLQAGINDTSEGINIHGGTLNISGRNCVVTCSGSLNVTGGSLTVNADEGFTAVITNGGGIHLENVELLKPVNGGVGSHEFSDSTQYTILDANGYDATAVVIGEPVAPVDVKFQAKNDGTAIRLLSHVDDLTKYTNVTFRISDGESTCDLVCTNAYTSLLASGKQLTASDIFGESANYIAIYTIDGIEVTDYDTELTVTVIWTHMDGTTTTGEARTITIGDLFN